MERSTQMESILRAFAGFISRQTYFDILWSEKVGYVRILAECPEAEGAMVLDTPEKLLDVLYTGIVEEVTNARYGNNYDPYEQGLTKEDQMECQKRAAVFWEAMSSERAFCMSYFIDFLQSHFLRPS